MSYLRTRFLALVAVVSATATGCGPTLYMANSGRAGRELERARAANADTLAPYEFYYAEAMYSKAREDAGEAAYQDAIQYARLAEESAQQAVDRARAAMREQGR